MTANRRSTRLTRITPRCITRGGLSAEMAIVSPILILLLFGTIEMGLLFKDILALSSACREAARVAAVGATVSGISARARAAATTLDSSQITVSGRYRIYSGGAWGAWTTLADSATGENNAPSGAQIQITLTYPHHLVTGALFGYFATDPGTNAVIVRSNTVIMRE